ncbi:mandelate racemase/muconate lactonizing enzyme family protein [Xylophilus sp.]|uniref:mandelate racemase/muconate lactonizing enzyme family protein n=1 Tax=Xylophilus sp. TaxID=2653893 RepID=UPI002D80F791|nr:mandelate racemase/muconate lactonizing enzyme family protein [Xylophilus sp.]
MKITSFRAALVEVPDEDLVAIAETRQACTRPIVALQLHTDAGVAGIGIGFSVGGMHGALLSAVEEFAELIVGEDPQRIHALRHKITRHAGTMAHAGIFCTALCAIDLALWDIAGKAANLPLWKLLGGFRQRVPTYSSGPLHRNITTAAGVKAAQAVKEQGFRYVKINLALEGEFAPNRELERARAVREALGPDIQLMADINDRWTVGQAVEMAHRLEEVGLFCIEDPVRHSDYDGMAHVTASTHTQIMSGESVWGVAPFREMFARRSVDICMIDVMHVGGITAWMEVAAMARAHGLPVVSHIMPEFQAQLVAAVPNGLLAEYKAWTWRLFDGAPVFEQGDFVLSDRPGHGLEFSAEFKQQL